MAKLASDERAGPIVDHGACHVDLEQPAGGQLFHQAQKANLMLLQPRIGTLAAHVADANRSAGERRIHDALAKAGAALKGERLFHAAPAPAERSTKEKRKNNNQLKKITDRCHRIFRAAQGVPGPRPGCLNRLELSWRGVLCRLQSKQSKPDHPPV